MTQEQIIKGHEIIGKIKREQQDEITKLTRRFESRILKVKRQHEDELFKLLSENFSPIMTTNEARGIVGLPPLQS